MSKNKDVGMLSLLSSSVFKNSDGKISTPKTGLAIAVLIAIVIIPELFIHLLSFAIIGIFAFWIGKALFMHPKIAESLKFTTNKESNNEQPA